VSRSDIDPDVELLADVPIAGTEEDLLGRQPCAIRLAELAIAPPETKPRVVALTGACGAGKTSVLNMASAIIDARAELEIVAVDAELHTSTQAVVTALAAELDALFSRLGVEEARDRVRNTLASYGGIVSGLIRIAGVKVDIASVLARSPASLRADIANDLEKAGKRVVIVVDHLDRLPAAEIGVAFDALRMYAAIPYVAMVIAVDRHALAMRPGGDPRSFERLVHVELVLPPPDRGVLARVMAGGLERIAARARRDLQPASILFEPDGGLGLELIETPRDTKRAINALAAGLPLLPADANVYLEALELVLRVMVPEIDGARLAARRRTAAADREALVAELADPLAQLSRASAARSALRALIVGD